MLLEAGFSSAEVLDDWKHPLNRRVLALCPARMAVCRALAGCCGTARGTCGSGQQPECPLHCIGAPGRAPQFSVDASAVPSTQVLYCQGMSAAGAQWTYQSIALPVASRNACTHPHGSLPAVGRATPAAGHAVISLVQPQRFWFFRLVLLMKKATLWPGHLQPPTPSASEPHRAPPGTDSASTLAKCALVCT